jgi:hypothetical protein
MNNTIIIKWVQDTDLPLTIIAQNTGISRKTLHNIKIGKPARTSTLSKLYLVYQKEIQLINNNLELKDTSMDISDFLTETEDDAQNSIDAKYVIQLQKDKIKQQEKEITMYKDYIDTQPLQKLQFDEISEDMSSTVQVRNVFSLKPMERKMSIGNGSEKLEKLLGLPKGHQFFAPNEWFTFDKHPVDAIIDQETLGELKKITRTLPSLFESLKFMVGNHYMTFPVIYKYKRKRVRTMCYLLLDWTSRPKRILTKTVILNENNE